jgi:hypothetical protein
LKLEAKGPVLHLDGAGLAPFLLKEVTMPKPKKDEKEKDFISRCIPIVMDEGTAEDNKQLQTIRSDGEGRTRFSWLRSDYELVTKKRNQVCRD